MADGALGTSESNWKGGRDMGQYGKTIYFLHNSVSSLN